MSYKSKNHILMFILIAILIIAIVGVAILSSGFRNWDATTWFQSNEDSVDLVDEEKDIDNSFVIGESVGTGVSLRSEVIPKSEYALYGVSSLAESAYTINAIIYPDNADNKSVEWSIAFKNSSSAWANGKNVSDYLSIASGNDGALSATITCKKAFGEQIIITCESSENSEISASCTVDYEKKVNDVTTTLNINDSSYVIDDGVGVPYFTSGTLDLDIEFSDYTIDKTYSSEVHIMFNSTFNSGLVEYMNEKYPNTFTDEAYVVLMESTFNYGDLIGALLNPSTSVPPQIANMLLSDIYSYINSYSGNVLTMRVSMGDVVREYDFKFSERLVINIASIDLDNSSIVF